MSNSAKFVAVSMLARRDYSRLEVKNKLVTKAFENVEIEQTLDECEAQGFLDDNRYAGLLLRSHVSKGHGNMRIKQVMIQKGLNKECIEQAFNASDCDWFELAKNKAIKKYQVPRTNDHKEKAKRVRYLAGQGFSFEQIAYALDYDPDDEYE